MATLKSIKNKYLGATDGAVLGVDTNTENIAALSFKLATADSLSKFNLVDGFSDKYNDATGVDAVASSDEVRDSGNYYSGKDAVVGSGGTISDVGTDKLHKFAFSQSGTTFSVTASQNVTVTYLVVAGGGAGFSGCGGGGSYGGGGGAGGYRASTFTAVSGTNYTITVGEGGDINSCAMGENGGDSSIAGSGLTTITATGGGAGGGGNTAGNAGGSGGGSGGQGSNTGGGPGAGNTPSTTPAQGTSGGTSEGDNGDGRAYGGGGGASEAGGVDTGASGGDGTSNSITGTATFYAGGGGGAGFQNRAGTGTGGDGGGGAGGHQSAAASSGTDGLGGGGGGSGDGHAAGNGGDGVVYLRYGATLGYEDMTLQSNTFTAQADPTTARIILDEASAAGTTTADQDIKAYASRDNGSNFTQIPLTDQGDLLIQNQGGIDSYNKLMLHMDGANDGTTFTDSSDSGRVVTANADVHTDTGEKKFGTASAQFDGTGDFLSASDSDDWDIVGSADDYTIDFWCYFSSQSGDRQMVEQYEDASNRWSLSCNATTGFVFKAYTGGSAIVETPTMGTSVPNSTWMHIALVKYGDIYTIYKDGTNTAATVTDSSTDTYSGLLRIGGYGAGSNWFHGYIDELRMSKGIARWTSAFTPPTAPYTTGTPVEFTRRMLSGSVDISGQPSGTNMKYKIETLNQSASKITRVYGTSMAWA